MLYSGGDEPLRIQERRSAMDDDDKKSEEELKQILAAHIGPLGHP